MSSIWSALTKLKEKINGGSTLLPESSDSPIPVNSHGLPQKAVDSAVQFQGSSQHYEHYDGMDASTSRPCTTPLKSSTASALDDLPTPTPGGGKRKGVPPVTAKKLAANVAVLGAMMMTPLRDVLQQTSGTLDFLEVACSSTSSLSTEMEAMGYTIQRINMLEGYDLEKKSGTQKLQTLIEDRKPRHTWVSLACTRLTSLSNLTRRDEVEEAAFQKKRSRDLKRAEEVAEGTESILKNGDDISWEWPTMAKSGWSSRAIRKLQLLCERHHRHLYFCHFHGCAYGLTYNNYPVQKSWTVATTDRHVWLSLQRKCPGHQDHLHCRGQVAKASAYYPQQMVKAVCRAISSTWTSKEDRAGLSLGRDVCQFLLKAEDVAEETYGMRGCPCDLECYGIFKGHQLAHQEDPQILALRRQRMPAEMPKGKALENIKNQMLRIHKASGHSALANLQRLLRARQAPPWAVALAGQIKCPDCSEVKIPPSASVASLQETPGLFEILGCDVFEFEAGPHKYKFLLMRDRASGLIQTELLQQFAGEGQPSAWEPTSEDIIRMLGRWMMFNPSPKWLLVDSATYFTSQRLMDFCSESGLGLLATPAESHEMLGAEEGAIKILKGTVEKLLKDHGDLSVELAFHLAAHGHNQSVGGSGFSPFQWTRGSSAPFENLPLGLNPRKAFGGMLKLKESARVAYEHESARFRLSKLNNTTPKPVPVFKPGQLVMLWRQRIKPGKTGGRWIGPVRFLLQEGKTLWLASGSTLIRARTQQVRSCTRREQHVAALEGTAILQMPVTLEGLLRSFTGRNFSDLTGEAPSEEQLQQDVQGAEVEREPKVNARPDTWKFVQDGGRRWLVRLHHLPRLSLFAPSRVATVPIDEQDLTGLRKTKVRSVQSGSDEIIEIQDDFKTSEDPIRSLQDRWVGETWLEIKNEAKAAAPKQKTLRPTRTSTKRKAESEIPKEDLNEELDEDDDDAPRPASSSGSVLLPHVPVISPLTTALREAGPDAVDGIRTGHQTQQNSCSLDACVLPGGHAGPHEDQEGKQFNWTEHTGRVEISEDEQVDRASTSSSSTPSDSEEMIPSNPAEDANHSQLYARKLKHMTDSNEVFQMQHTHENDMVHENAEAGQNTKVLKNDIAPQNANQTENDKRVFYALEVPLLPSDLTYLTKNPEKSEVWLSKKMIEKGKEKRWSQMDLEEKHKFDMSMAKELSNVLSSKALRSLTSQEWDDLDYNKVASMRWVLTVKSDGSAKARLVVLGFQMPDIEHMETASPTMARVSRSLLLAVVANNGFKLKAGDVTAAFLQTEESLEHLEMTVWAPSELAVLFGADPSNPIMPLRVSRAFYGLVQAPRCWFNDVSRRMLAQGWKTVLADRCLFVLYDDDTGDVIAIAGIHVDDFLIGGNEDHPKYQQAFKQLVDTYKWGKWQEGEIDFAGCHIVQLTDGSIRVDQSTYVEKWLDEVQLPKQRMQQVKSSLTPQEVSMVRGVLGTLAWKSSQTGPHHQADVGMILSELPMATIHTVQKLNKLVREVRREAPQGLLFPSWRRSWKDFVVVSWADAGQQNRADHASTLGVITGLAPIEFLQGEECVVCVLNWKSSKTPRQCLGSNGAEVQAITEGEDITFRIRAMWAEIHGIRLTKSNLYDSVRDTTVGAVVMDTKGIFDAMTRNVSALHGLRSSRAGYELTLSVQQAMRIATKLRWVNGLAQLADCLTKFNQKKLFLQFLAGGQKWKLVFDEKFVAGKKLRKRQLEEATRSMETFFISRVREFALANRFPWTDDDSRSVGDESLADPVQHVSLVCSVESSHVSHLSD